ncbi:MAG: trigger factor, partial [Clostridiales bacterium]|nr:trigger factor [Clostridiales bacterium]
YMDMMDTGADSLREVFAARAEDEVRTQLVLEKIREVEQIEVSDEDIDKEIKEMAETYKQTEEELRKNLSEDDIEYLKNSILITKTVDFLVENAKFV